MIKRIYGLRFALCAVALLSMASCSPDDPNDGKGDDPKVDTPKTPRVAGPVFNADSAYAFIEAQVAFGPRVPGTPEHDKCAEWIAGKMKSFGLAVEVQKAPATLYTGRMITMQNIMAQYKPERTTRILLVAHWDTRHIADRDTGRVNEPIDGANDGGSGVAVLMEIGRIIAEKDPGIGVDFLFVDAEDHGQPGGDPETWCLGSQYWAQTVKTDYVKTVRYGILLDMVGARGAVFPREGTSVYYASGVVEKVWSAAHNLGYNNYFSNNVIGETVDDNLFINQYARIPCIDIVHYDPAEQDYGPFHHRHTDNMDIIDKATLDAVGKVVVDVIWNEKVK
jgi:glutaminyl-peptide cyclotransferase